MQISKALEDAIREQNLVRIYGGFYVIAHENPNFSSGKFDETLQYIKSKNIPGFMQEYNGKKFLEKEKWTEEYWAEVVSDLIDNFCEERIQHLKEVGRFLFPVPKTAHSKNMNAEAKCRQRINPARDIKGGETHRRSKPSVREWLAEGVDILFGTHDTGKNEIKQRINQESNKKNNEIYRTVNKHNK